MKTKIVVLATDGDMREDGNVYYCDFLIVQTDTLNFDEPFFDDNAVFDDTFKNAAKALQALGYTVTNPERKYIVCSES